jgi:hypothetical protein
MGERGKSPVMYRYFQKAATGMGVLPLAVGGALHATDQIMIGDLLMFAGGVVFFHGLLALDIISFEDRKSDRQ